jgi:uncharacterized delta-60 repeat protein
MTVNDPRRTSPRTAPWSVGVGLAGAAGVSLALALAAPLGIAQAGGVAPSPAGSVAPTQPPSSLFLDPTFGVEGKTTTERFGGERSAMALQPDGKVVMVGGTSIDFIMARFDVGGQLDTTFGDGGFVTTDMVPDQQEESLAVAIQPDGAIVLAGYVGFDATFALARYLADGTLDTTFGADGRVMGDVPGRAYAVAVQPDGGIVAAGETTVGGSDPDWSDLVLARYLPEGTLDTSFGEGGIVVTDIAGGTNLARNIVITADGGIILTGEPIGDFPGSDHTDIARYAADGQLDAAFGTGGVLALVGARVGEGLAVQDDGRLVLVGQAVVAEERRFAVTRLGADGTPDDTFGEGGLVTTDVADQGDAATAVAIDHEGRIVVAGWSGDINNDFAVVRYLSDGSLDPGFANGGTLTVDFVLLPDIAESVAVQSDGMIVLGGVVQQGFKGYGLARVLP